VGPAAWIVEKWRAWSDCDGRVDRRFSADELLDVVMPAALAEDLRRFFRPLRRRH
jgi:hypothetical protein